MKAHQKLTRHLERTGKFAASPGKRRELVARGLMSQGGTARDPVDNANPPRDQAAFVRALLGR